MADHRNDVIHCADAFDAPTGTALGRLIGDHMRKIELADLIAALRAEVGRAWVEGQHDPVAFEAGPITVEVTTEVEVVQAGGSITAKFWVLEMGANASRTSTSTQRISFSITPRDRRFPTQPILIGAEAKSGERMMRRPD